MDQHPVVNEQIDGGKRLIRKLVESGFDVGIAFWAKPTEDGKWFLYLASSTVDDKGPAVAYRHVHRVLETIPDSWIGPLQVKVLGLHDSVAEAVLEVIKPRVPNSPYSVPNPKPFPGMTSYGGASIGGLSIDGALIYPPSQVGAPA